MPEHLLEPDADKIFGMCDWCGQEIYEGEGYYAIEDDKIHEDCLHDYCRDLYSDCIKEAVMK